MNIKLVNPANAYALTLSEEGLIQSGNIVFPLINGAYRIVNNTNYTDNFGFQWNLFDKTQIDKNAKFDLSRRRFFAETGWDKEDLTGQNIL